jgi:hypothetical protein
MVAVQTKHTFMHCLLLVFVPQIVSVLWNVYSSGAQLQYLYMELHLNHEHSILNLEFWVINMIKACLVHLSSI